MMEAAGVRRLQRTRTNAGVKPPPTLPAPTGSTGLSNARRRPQGGPLRDLTNVQPASALGSARLKRAPGAKKLLENSRGCEAKESNKEPSRALLVNERPLARTNSCTKVRRSSSSTSRRAPATPPSAGSAGRRRSSTPDLYGTRRRSTSRRGSSSSSRSASATDRGGWRPAPPLPSPSPPPQPRRSGSAGGGTRLRRSPLRRVSSNAPSRPPSLSLSMTENEYPQGPAPPPVVGASLFGAANAMRALTEEVAELRGEVAGLRGARAAAEKELQSERRVMGEKERALSEKVSELCQLLQREGDQRAIADRMRDELTAELSAARIEADQLRGRAREADDAATAAELRSHVPRGPQNGKPGDHHHDADKLTDLTRRFDEGCTRQQELEKDNAVLRDERERLESGIAELRRSIDERAECAARLRDDEELERRRLLHRVEAAEAARSEAQQALEGLRMDSQRQGTELADAKEWRRDAEAALSAAKDELQCARRDVERLQRGVEERDAETARLRNEVATKEAALERLQQERIAADVRTARLRQAVARLKEEKLNALQRAVERLAERREQAGDRRVGELRRSCDLTIGGEECSSVSSFDDSRVTRGAAGSTAEDGFMTDFGSPFTSPPTAASLRREASPSV